MQRSAQRNAAKGDPELALSNDEMVIKAKMLLDHAGFDDAEAQRVIDGVLGLVEGDGSPEIVRRVLQHLR